MRPGKERFLSAVTATRGIFPPTLRPATSKSRGLARGHNKAHPDCVRAADIFWLAADAFTCRLGCPGCDRCDGAETPRSDRSRLGSDFKRCGAWGNDRRLARPAGPAVLGRKRLRAPAPAPTANG